MSQFIVRFPLLSTGRLFSNTASPADAHCLSGEFECGLDLVGAAQECMPPEDGTAVMALTTRRSILALLGSSAVTALLAGWDVVDVDAATCVTANEVELLRLINAYRATKNLAALKMSSRVAAAARTHSHDMAARSYLTHTTKGTSNKAGERMKAAGYPYIGKTAYGEIIHRGNGNLSSPQAAFNWWKNSSGHNALMLDSRFTTAGVGRWKGSGTNPYTYSTVDFAGKFDRAASSCQ